MANWRETADDNFAAAAQLVQRHWRSALSRAYYAAYARATVTLEECGMTFPGDREGPAHNQLPDLVEKACVKRLGKTRWKAHGLLRGLYVMRVNADYHPSVEVGPGDAREALSMMREVFRLMERADHGKAGKKRNR